MLAETAYNVIQVLTESERARLFVMLGVKSESVIAKKENKSPVWTAQEFYDAALQVMNAKRAKKNGYELKAV